MPTDHLLPARCQTLADAARAVEAPEDADKLYHYICDSATQARQLVGALGGDIPIPTDREHHIYVFYGRNGGVLSASVYESFWRVC